jgi:REP element-mobilizing transposase RayT
VRTVRLTIPGVTYHLISRFVDQRWYFQSGEERRHYLQLLGASLRDSDWKCVSYALMSSHLHLGMVAGSSALESWARRAHAPFASWINFRHDRIGPVFVRGPKDYGVPPNAVGSMIAYIHNNPVRAGVVERASDSDWTSHNAYLGRAPCPDWLDVDRGLALSDLTATEFDEWVRSEPDDPSRAELRGFRRAMPRGQLVLATPMASDPVVVPIMMRPRAHLRVDPRWIVQQTAAVVGVDIYELGSRNRKPHVVGARRVAARVAAAFGVAVVDIAAAMGMSGSAVTMMSRKPLTEEQARFRDLVVERIETLTGIAIEVRPSRGA